MKRAVIICTDGTKHILYDSEQEKLIEFVHIVVNNLEDEGQKVLSMNIEHIQALDRKQKQQKKALRELDKAVKKRNERIEELEDHIEYLEERIDALDGWIEENL